MWVYIYQSWTEKELLNAYIWEYTEPTATLDVDFTTLSSLDWFTVSSNGWTQLNSNWLSWQTSSGDRILDIYHDLPWSRTDAKKVTMTMELYWVYRSWGLTQWFELQNTDGNKGIGWNITLNNNGSSYQWNSIGMISGTTLASRTQANPTWTYTYTIEVDLITGEWSGGYTWPNTFSGSWTLTSAQIDEIKQTTRIHVDIRWQYTDYNWLRKLNVTIEY